MNYPRFCYYRTAVVGIEANWVSLASSLGISEVSIKSATRVCLHSERGFHCITELSAQKALAQGLVEQFSRPLAHFSQILWGHCLHASNDVDGGLGITMGNLKPNIVLVKQIADMRGAWAQEKDGFAGGHGAVDLAGVNDPNHGLAQRNDVDVRCGQGVFQF
jgi:hypothetical protein